MRLLDSNAQNFIQVVRQSDYPIHANSMVETTQKYVIRIEKI